MKKILLILFFGLIFSQVFAQNNNNNNNNTSDASKGKLKALKVAHITEQLNLSEQESQVFWPVYNENETIKAQIRESRLGKLHASEINKLSDAEAEARLKNLVELQEKRQEQERKYQKKLVKILSAKKVLLLKHAEHSFRRKVLQAYKGRHKRANEKN